MTPNKIIHKGQKIQTQVIEYQERDIARILIAAGDQWYDEEKEVRIVDYIFTNLEGVLQFFIDPISKKIIDEYTSEIYKGRYPQRNHWSNHENQEIASFAVNILSEKYTYAQWSKKGLELQTQKPIEENYVRDSYQAIMRFKLKKINERILEVKSLLNRNEDRSKDVLLITAYQNLLTERQEIAEDLNLTVI